MNQPNTDAQVAQESLIIGDREFRVGPIDPFEATDILADIVAVLGTAAGRVETNKAEDKSPGASPDEALDEDSIAEVLAQWTGIPVHRLTEEEAARLVHMESELHKRIIGQHDAITAVSKAIRRTRAGLKDPRRPSGSFIFLGPSGVGKTETAKALTEFLFGKEDALIQLDMSEYMEKHTSRAAAATFSSGVTTAIRSTRADPCSASTTSPSIASVSASRASRSIAPRSRDFPSPSRFTGTRATFTTRARSRSPGRAWCARGSPRS